MKKNKSSIVITVVLVVSVLGTLLLSGCNIPKKNKNDENNAVQISEEDVKKALEDTKTNEEETKQEEGKPVELAPGAYSMEYTDEIEGTQVSISYYVLFNEDGTGFCIASDDVTMKWADGTITFEDGNINTYVAKADKTVEIKDPKIEGEPLVYTYVGPELPEDVVDSMRLNLDGTEKITNFDAADEFNYIINSDTINFYDYSGAVNYSATEGELNDMRAAYLELTDKKYPVLFIESPEAPHAVGYTHVLQYLDKTVYDVAGLDDVREVWKNAGLVSMTYTGGGYGETNYHYYGFDDEGNMIEIASKIVMEDDEYAKDYKTNFGEDFVDEFYIGSYDQSESVTKEDFDTWLLEKTNGEEAISVKWLPLDKAVPF